MFVFMIFVISPEGAVFRFQIHVHLFHSLLYPCRLWYVAMLIICLMMLQLCVCVYASTNRRHLVMKVLIILFIQYFVVASLVCDDAVDVGVFVMVSFGAS